MGNKPSSNARSYKQLNLHINDLLKSNDLTDQKRAFEEHIIPLLLSGDNNRIKYLMHDLYIERRIYGYLDNRINDTDESGKNEIFLIIQGILGVQTHYLTDELLVQLEHNFVPWLAKMIKGNNPSKQEMAFEMVALVLGSVSTYSYKNYPNVISLVNQAVGESKLHAKIIQLIEDSETVQNKRTLETFVIPLIYSGYYDQLQDTPLPTQIVDLICNTTHTLVSQQTNNPYDLYLGRILNKSPSSLASGVLEDSSTINFLEAQLTRAISLRNVDKKELAYTHMIRPILVSGSKAAINQILQNFKVRNFLVDRIKNQIKEERKMKKNDLQNSIFNLEKDADLRLLLDVHSIEMTSSLLTDASIRNDVRTILDYSRHDPAKTLSLVVHILEINLARDFVETFSDFTIASCQSEIERLAAIHESQQELASNIIHQIIRSDPGSTKVLILSNPNIYDFMSTMNNQEKEFSEVLAAVKARIDDSLNQGMDSHRPNLVSTSSSSFLSRTLSKISPSIAQKIEQSSFTVESASCTSSSHSDAHRLLKTSESMETGERTSSSTASKITNTSAEEGDYFPETVASKISLGSAWDNFSVASKDKNGGPLEANQQKGFTNKIKQIRP